MRHPDPNFGYPSLPLADKRWPAPSRASESPLKKQAILSPFTRQGAFVLDSHIDALTWDECINRIATWATLRQSRYVTLCNVHSVVTASEDAEFRRVIEQADLALPDGAPIAWALRREGHPEQTRLSGPDLMWRYLAEAQRLKQRVFFYGSTPETLDKLRARIVAHFPRLQIAGMVSPPYRSLTPEEDQAHIDQINRSGAHVVFVGLGCPKQEGWMSAHRGRVHAVMLGVGAAFDYHAGTLARAPLWMQKAGLEWLHRLASEPRRLLKRYLHTNTVFVGRMLKLMLTGRRSGKGQEA